MTTSIFSKVLLFAGSMLSATLLSTSCNKDNTVDVENNSSDRISISVGVTTPLSTKATTISADDEKAITSLQVFLFREDGTLDTYAKGQSSSLSLSCTAGVRTIYALVNAPDQTSVTTKEAFEKCTSYLYDNSDKAFEMIGGVSTEVKAGESIEIPVKRIVSRVRIESITTAFTSEVYKKSTFSIDKIYLVNAAGNIKFSDFALENPTTTTPSTWLNKKANSEEIAKLLLDEVSTELANGETYSTVHSFYTYPNPTTEDSQETIWCPRYTRLVVEATLAGVKYYYPISIPEIGSNKTYTITSLTITRPGSDSADKPVTKAECSFAASITDWTTVTPSSEEI